LLKKKACLWRKEWRTYPTCWMSSWPNMMMMMMMMIQATVFTWIQPFFFFYKNKIFFSIFPLIYLIDGMIPNSIILYAFALKKWIYCDGKMMLN
jgi:hypothetical protein